MRPRYIKRVGLDSAAGWRSQRQQPNLWAVAVGQHPLMGHGNAGQLFSGGANVGLLLFQTQQLATPENSVTPPKAARTFMVCVRSFVERQQAGVATSTALGLVSRQALVGHAARALAA